MPERQDLGYKRYLPGFLQHRNKIHSVDPALMWGRILTGMTAWGFAAFSSNYKAHHTELLSSYGKDFIAPLIFYSFAQALTLAGPKFERFGKPKATLAVYGIYALGVEFMQAQSQGLNDALGSRYDPYDILALGLGTAFALGVNKYLNRRFRQDN